MIKLQNYTPSIYYNQSRDFQFIGRLYDIVLNSIKTNADLLNSLPVSDNFNSQLVDLLTLTLGFKSKYNYNTEQLVAICKAFLYILKNKGNITAIIDACNTLLNAEGSDKLIRYIVDENNAMITLYFPTNLDTFNLLKDMLNYILPAGMRCTLIKEYGLINTGNTTVNINSKATPYLVKDTDTSFMVQWNRMQHNNDGIKDTPGYPINSMITNQYLPNQVRLPNFTENYEIPDDQDSDETEQ